MPARLISLLSRTAAVALLASLLIGCNAEDRRFTGSIMKTSQTRTIVTTEQREARWRELSAQYGEAYAKNPNDASVAYGYGLALRALGQRAQALAVLEQASLKNPGQRQILAAYGRALADVGRYQEALGVLDRAHSPDAPDWRILNAQGAILDQLGRSDEARSYYDAALKIEPGDPSILSNLALSYALTKDLAKADETIRLAVASPKADDTVRANLALVERLKGAAPSKKAKA